MECKRRNDEYEYENSGLVSQCVGERLKKTERLLNREIEKKRGS
jgi:hypothetical protein